MLTSLWIKYKLVFYSAFYIACFTTLCLGIYKSYQYGCEVTETKYELIISERNAAELKAINTKQKEVDKASYELKDLMGKIAEKDVKNEAEKNSIKLVYDKRINSLLTQLRADRTGDSRQVTDTSAGAIKEYNLSTTPTDSEERFKRFSEVAFSNSVKGDEAIERLNLCIKAYDEVKDKINKKD